MPYCQECGTPNPDYAKFCSKCGTSLGVGSAKPFQRVELKKNSPLEWALFFACSVFIPLGGWIIAAIHLVQISRGTRDSDGKWLYYIGIIIGIVVAMISCAIINASTQFVQDMQMQEIGSGYPYYPFFIITFANLFRIRKLK